jgi:4-hydroxythreonine-4-phosphate dehydrogenase
VTHRPIAISCGEPAGIGPEVAAKAWALLRDEMPMLWIGDPGHLPAGTPFEVVTAAEAAAVSPRALPVLARDFGPALTPGVAQAAHAPGVVAAIADAVALVQSGACAALCTAPIHKAALIDGAAFAYPGHTEFLAALAGNVPVVMMLASGDFRVVPATIHIPCAPCRSADRRGARADHRHHPRRTQAGLRAGIAAHRCGGAEPPRRRGWQDGDRGPRPDRPRGGAARR